MSQSKSGSDYSFTKLVKDKGLDKSLALGIQSQGCYNDNLALMLSPESDETIRLDKESRSKLRDLIKLFDYDQLNNLYDLFVPQLEKSPEQHYFPRTSKMSHTSSNNEFSKESFCKQTTLLAKRMDESIHWDQKCKSSKEIFKIKKSVDTIFDGVERCKQTIAKITYFGVIPIIVLADHSLKSNQLEDRVMLTIVMGRRNLNAKELLRKESKKNVFYTRLPRAQKDGLPLLHMDLCVQYGDRELNGKEIVRVIIDDYSSDIPGIKLLEFKLTEAWKFLNLKPLLAYFCKIGHKEHRNITLLVTPEQNGIVGRRNFTCKSSNVDNTLPYHQCRKPSVNSLNIFGFSLLYRLDGENLDKMKEKKMASDHVSSDPGLQCSTTVLEQDSLSPGLQSQENVPKGPLRQKQSQMSWELLYRGPDGSNELLNGNFSCWVNVFRLLHAADNTINAKTTYKTPLLQ
ncbi:hypothetical protein Tco_0637024 [Tanacetum coccineum]